MGAWQLAIGGSMGRECMVAQLIATDRKQQLYEAASLIPIFYAVKSPEADEAQHTATAVHRKTDRPTVNLADFWFILDKQKSICY